MNKSQKTKAAVNATHERFLINQKLSKRLRMLRELAQPRLTQGDLAILMDCHYTTVQVWENSNPGGMSVFALLKLAKIMGRNPQDLIRGIHL